MVADLEPLGLLKNSDRAIWRRTAKPGAGVEAVRVYREQGKCVKTG